MAALRGRNVGSPRLLIHLSGPPCVCAYDLIRNYRVRLKIIVRLPETPAIISCGKNDKEIFVVGGLRRV